LRTDRLLLGDMLDAILEVLTTTPPTRAEFDANKLVRSHIVRNIQIIGEAAWRLPQSLKDAYPAVPWRAIAGMRHAIVHDYFEIDWDAVWEVTQRHTASLQPQIEGILASLPANPPSP
jgi:uncharacterized protein with HEPN domain